MFAFNKFFLKSRAAVLERDGYHSSARLGHSEAAAPAVPGPCTSPGWFGHLSLLIPWLSSLGLPLPVTARCSLSPRLGGTFTLPVTIGGHTRSPGITNISSWRSQIHHPSPEHSTTLSVEQGKVFTELSSALTSSCLLLRASVIHQHLLQRFYHD